MTITPKSPAPHKPKSKNHLLKRFYELQKSKGKPAKYITLYIAGVVFGFVFLVTLGVGVYMLHDIPSITKIEDDVLPESTIIYDRNGNELYNLYNEERRTYVPYGQISDYIRSAIVSTEDKTFFENQGIDFRGLVRSGVNFITGKTDKIQGTSTISQQLIKNMFLSNERSVVRKVKEIFLSYQLNSKYSKEKILELYLNKISFWNNAFGIEEASKTYFGKSSKDVGILGSAVLASLPKGPSYYSPYTHRDRLMGSLFVYHVDSPKDTIGLDTPEKMTQFAPMVAGFKKFLGDIEFKPYSQDKVELCGIDPKKLKKSMSLSWGCAVIDYSDLLTFLNNIRIPSTDTMKVTGSGSEDSSPYALEYNTGRKDFVLGRMFEDQKIKGNDYKNNVIAGIDFQFRKYQENIKYPHFVFYVKEYLENKYGKDFETQGGLKIYTTIDPTLQDKAQELVTKQVKINATKYGAKSAALVSLDNKTGQILAMVGGADFFDTEADGNVNIITSKRQPGSSFKPIIYTLAVSKNPIGPDTPIFDVDTKFGDWQPDNYDEKFLGKMSLKKALDYSRNIPAAKMFYLAGGENDIVNFSHSLGIASLSDDGNYGAPLAIGVGELKPIELAEAYSTFANGGYRKDPTPILKITDKKGNIIEQYTESAGKSVVSEAAAYIISTILSDASSRPSDFWNNVLTLKDRPVAAKTGTSNKDVSKGGKKKILPRDLWTAGYTPQITTVVWAGNIDGSETKGTCDGLNCAAPIWHDFMEAAHKKLPKEVFKKPDSIFSATISQISGRLASDSTPDNLRVTSIFAVKPTEYEGGMKQVEVDSLCNGKVTDQTPRDAIKQVYLSSGINPVIDSYDKAWMPPIYGWLKSEAGQAYFNSASSIVSEVSDEVCVRPNGSLSNVTVSSSFQEGNTYPIGKTPFEVKYAGDNPIARIDILRDDDQQVAQFKIDNQSSGVLKVTTVNFDDSFSGHHTLTFRAVDKYGYANTSSVAVFFDSTAVAPADVTLPDTAKPSSAATITLVNPTKDQGLKIFNDQYFNLRFSVQAGADETSAVNVYIDGALSKILDGGPDYAYAINENKDMSVGLHSATIEVIDAKSAKTKKTVSFEIMKR